MRLRLITTILLLFTALPLAAFSQDPSPSPTPEKAEEKPALTQNELLGLQIAESAILVYSRVQGRRGLDQIRKTGVEFGTLELYDSSGAVSRASYERRFLRGESLETTKIRMDQNFPDARYAMVYDGKKTFGVFNNKEFGPRTDVVEAFDNREHRGIEALLRYAESGAKVVFDRDEAVMAVDYAVVKLTDKNGRVTEYFVSKKSFRVMIIRYEQNGIKYERKFYDHNWAQNTLYPYRTVLTANGKKVEEQNTRTITFGQEIGEEYFTFNS